MCDWGKVGVKNLRDFSLLIKIVTNNILKYHTRKYFQLNSTNGNYHSQNLYPWQLNLEINYLPFFEVQYHTHNW